MKDEFANQVSSLTSPFNYCDQVIPSDTEDLPYASRSLYIGVSGDIRVTTIGGTTVTFRSHPVGYMPGRIRRVHATGTTAADIVAVW
ncbi:MAG: hypothetical protein D6686_08015 [Alphaproteobacteria bacterium]|nr:MAG: hypothetical protein D6686_08015 [Alphaproteobacteria bacterium]